MTALSRARKSIECWRKMVLALDWLPPSGFNHSRSRYGQMVRDANKLKRVDFCERLIAKNDKFDDVIFSDECSIQLHQNKLCSYRPKDSSAAVLPKPKNPLKIHVWAAISKRGATKIRLFGGIMDSTFYIENILRDTLLPFIHIITIIYLII